jgi:hypothetical protein
MNPGSVRCEADEIVSAFRVQFSIAASDKISLADLLASTKPNKGRNLSIRCERSIAQSEAADLLLKNIEFWSRIATSSFE